MRRLLALIRGLPPNSALSAAVIGDWWTADTALLATIADRLGIMAAGLQLKEQPPAVPLPEGLRPEPVVADTATVMAFFGGGG